MNTVFFLDESKRVRTQPERYTLAVGCQLSSGSIHLSRALPAKHLNDTNRSPMGGTLACSPLVFCFLSELQQLECFPSGKLKHVSADLKKKATRASIEDSIFLRNIIITASGRGLEGCLCHLRRPLTSQNYFCGGKNICSRFLFCCRFINRLPPTGLRRVAALPAPGDSQGSACAKTRRCKMYQ